jgi:hypothetical protein
MRWIIPLLACTLAQAQDGWWMREPLRWLQTNLRETDAALDPEQLVAQAAGFHANVLHYSMGAIAAHYPTRVAFHYASPFLPAGRDVFGQVLAAAHSRGIRVVGRFDFSKVRGEAYQAHPEWFFRQADGKPVIYNGLYSTCINGGYYREKAMEILTEALERYEVDGLFFNMFGNQQRDYSGNRVGLCHCDACRRLYGKPIPDQPDAGYDGWMAGETRKVAAAIGELIHRKRPHAGYFNYMQEFTDGVMSESNTAVDRPLPLWPYSASDNVNRARSSQPDKQSVNLCMQFVDFFWRFATVPPGEIALRLWENVANGGALALAINGTFEQNDRQALDAARPVFQWTAAKERYYAGQHNAARVVLQNGPQNSYRGLFRWLSEEHIPFQAMDNTRWTAQPGTDVAIACGRAPAELGRWVERGGKLLIVGPQPPGFAVARVRETVPDVKGYVRVRDHQRFPSLARTELLMLDGAFTAVDGTGPLTLVPPSMFGPPEKIHSDMRDTDTPAWVTVELGKGRVIWIPWDTGALYYRHSLPAHLGLLRDSLAQLMAGRQILTNAHPLVEMTLMRQGAGLRLHLINLSGHSQTGYFAPVPMQGIEVSLEGEWHRVDAVRHPAALAATVGDGRTRFTVPLLADYELVTLEK